MRKRRKTVGLIFMSLIIFSLIMSGCSSDSSSPKKEQNKQDQNQNSERIVATTVSVTEIMDALEVDLIGIPTSYKDLPKRYKNATEVGNPMSPDMEMIMSLKPTDVMSVTTLQYDLESVFNDAGIETDYINLESLDNMHSEIRRLGKKYGREEQAEQIVSAFEKKISEIEEENKNKEKPKVLILLGVPGSYLVATEHSYIGDLVRRSGGINVVQGEKEEYLASNTEYLQQSNPDIILRAAHGMPEEVVKMFDEEFKTNDIWKHFKAVKNDRVYDLEELLFGTTGNLAAKEALDELQLMLYP